MFKRFIAISLLVSIALTGCGIDYKKFLKKKEEVVSNLPAEAILVDKNPIYEETLKLINSAQKAIYIEQFELDDRRIIDLLIKKSKSGIELKILLDQWESNNKRTLEELKNHNISVQFYPAQKGQYTRVKMLVVDHSQAIFYGPAWTDTPNFILASRDSHSLNSHTVAVKLTGKSAWKLATIFNRDWEFTTTLTLNVPKSTSLPDDNIILATNANVKQQIVEKINGSTQTIWLELSELTEQDTVQALMDAADKGRDVRIILDYINASSTPGVIENLKSKGIQIRYYKDRPLGVNLGIFDGKTFILSNSGWTRYTFLINHESSITVPSPAATAKVVEIYDKDWNSSLKELQ
ncbi:MAG: phosphatidylserine/phosphatidylglycerophosphate/cardiolipin synthase family protein [Desulfitobacterium hafniense]|nr:phosphatidylserine/phosphatidylglycerophosphate/cardiolipin synthase family protein [Desulfitobacterium hafniense]